jgi:formate dehydrogenase major subunit
MQKQIITINGNGLAFETGETILDVAKRNCIEIPTLCHLKNATPTGACRICMVEVQGARTLLPSCATPASSGMQVRTESSRVVAARRRILQLMLSSGNHNCAVYRGDAKSWTSFQIRVQTEEKGDGLCPVWGDCRLQDLAFRYQVSADCFDATPARYPLETGNPLIARDFSRCILCGRCIQACNEVQANRAISFGYRGAQSKIVAAGDRPLYDSECVFCGECIQVCPVGALTEKKAGFFCVPWGLSKIRTTCPYCGVGCQQLLHVKDERIVKVTGIEGAEPNQGRLCVKGRFGYDFIYSEDRLKTPLIREGKELREASWDQALDLIALKFKQFIAESGPDSVAGVSCARSINEDSYNMQKLFRAVFKTNNIDHCARSCHAPTVAGLAATFGSGAMTNSLNQISRAKMLMVIGSNMTEAHPVAATFVKNAVLKGAQLIVVDPRRHKLRDFADLHVPIRVGSDIAFLNALMQVLIENDWYDKNFVNSCTMDFDKLAATVKKYTPEYAADICGISAELIRNTARRISSVKPMMLCYTLGITEHTCGTHNVMSIANLQMLLGNLGVECGGVNPLRGQNNVQGACDMGALPNVFHGYQKVTDEAARKKFERAWNVEDLPSENGLQTPQMLEGLTDGRIRGFYIFGENLANVEPDIHKVEHELASAEFLVCQDIFPTETTRFAHVVLPAAAWSENDGTFTNCERRVSRVRTASAPPGVAKPNWWIFKQIAKRFGQEWASDSAQEIWDNEVSALSSMFGGIKYRRLEGDGLQWPCPDEKHSGTCILHTGGQFTCGLGIFRPAEWTPPAEVPDETYPFVFSTGRRLTHYHTRTQTGRCEGFNDILGEETADISPADAANLGILNGEIIRVASRRGEVKVKAKVTHEVPEGMVWMAFHFREACANWLTNPAYDNITMTAEYKACAVRIDKL